MQPMYNQRSNSQGSPLRGYHSSSSRPYEENVFPALSSSRQMLLPRMRCLSSATDGRKPDTKRTSRSGSFESNSLEASSHMDCSMEYLADLIKERKQLEMFPQAFQNVERLLEEEICRVRIALFQTDFSNKEIDLPEPMGEVITITEKIYVPVKEYPDYNFVGRILGPRGMTAKQLEQETGCKIMVRGKGSMKDRRKEEANRGRPNWEHLEDELHVLLQCEDTENRARVKLSVAKNHVKKLLVPAPEGTDELKRKQLMELAIINGTYRPYHKSSALVPVMSPVRAAPMFLSPTHGSPNSPALSPPSNSYNSAGTCSSYDYSPSLNPYLNINSSMLDAALASLQMSDLRLPPYPTATSLVNQFPNLFLSSSNLLPQDHHQPVSSHNNFTATPTK